MYGAGPLWPQVAGRDPTPSSASSTAPPSRPSSRAWRAASPTRVPMHPFFNHVQSTLSPSEAFFISLQCFWALAFLLVPRISISLLALPISTCILSPLFIRALSFLIIVVLISQSDHSSILAIYESGSNAWSFSIPTIFLPFSMPCKIFLLARHEVLAFSATW